MRLLADLSRGNAEPPPLPPAAVDAAASTALAWSLREGRATGGDRLPAAVEALLAPSAGAAAQARSLKSRVAVAVLTDPRTAAASAEGLVAAGQQASGGNGANNVALMAGSTLGTGASIRSGHASHPVQLLQAQQQLQQPRAWSGSSMAPAARPYATSTEMAATQAHAERMRAILGCTRGPVAVAGGSYSGRLPLPLRPASAASMGAFELGGCTSLHSSSMRGYEAARRAAFGEARRLAARPLQAGSWHGAGVTGSPADTSTWPHGSLNLCACCQQPLGACCLCSLDDGGGAFASSGDADDALLVGPLLAGVLDGGDAEVAAEAWVKAHEQV